MGNGINGNSKVMVTIRMLIGAYLLYIDYQVFDDVMAREGSMRIILLAVMVIFAAAGLMLIVIGIREYIAGESKGDAEDEGDGTGPGDVDGLSVKGGEMDKDRDDE